jgi:hypothetical protein
VDAVALLEPELTMTETAVLFTTLDAGTVHVIDVKFVTSALVHLILSTVTVDEEEKPEPTIVNW